MRQFTAFQPWQTLQQARYEALPILFFFFSFSVPSTVQYCSAEAAAERTGPLCVPGAPDNYGLDYRLIDIALYHYRLIAKKKKKKQIVKKLSHFYISKVHVTNWSLIRYTAVTHPTINSIQFHRCQRLVDEPFTILNTHLRRA